MRWHSCLIVILRCCIMYRLALGSEQEVLRALLADTKITLERASLIDSPLIGALAVAHDAHTLNALDPPSTPRHPYSHPHHAHTFSPDAHAHTTPTPRPHPQCFRPRPRLGNAMSRRCTRVTRPLASNAGRSTSAPHFLALSSPCCAPRRAPLATPFAFGH